MTMSSSADHFDLKHLQSVTADSGDKYVNQRFLGKGGNGVAFLVTCGSGPNEGMQFVLKILYRISDPSRIQAFKSEVEKLKQLSHPAIVQVFDEGTFRVSPTRHHPLVIMEYIPQTLRSLIVPTQGISDRIQAFRIALNILSALAAIHSLPNPIVHRDIKPANILVSSTAAKLADFGLAKELNVDGEDLEDEIPSIELTQFPAMPSSYRTPELVRRARQHLAEQSKEELTTASDIFQFGCVLYEILTGYNPQNPKEPDYKYVDSRIEPIVRKDKLLWDVVLRVHPDALGGKFGPKLCELILEMVKYKVDARPTAQDCLKRLGEIHKDLCGELKQTTGQDI